jgi:hypothetical protein
MTKLKRLIAVSALVALLFPGAAPDAMAQFVASPVEGPELATPSPPTHYPPRRYAGRRIEIYPGRLLFRRCVDWYELQHRPSGTVLFPQMHCWWVRG